MPTKRKKEKIVKPEMPDAKAFQRLASFVRAIIKVPKREAEAQSHRKMKGNG
jgi:hypothetical protein